MCVQSVILQRDQGVNSSAQICKRILFLLDYWNHEAFDELLKDTYNLAMGYMGKACAIQTGEQCHRNFSNLAQKEKLSEAVQFICDREKGGVLQPDELTEDRTGTINETVALGLEGKYPSEAILSCATLETYEETPIFIPVDITGEAVEPVARKLSGVYGPGGTDSKALQGWLLKFG